MKHEDKDLLLKDLCARMPYNPLVEYKGESYNVLGIAHGRLVLCKPFMSYTLKENPLVEEAKPYLFPLSSMTEEQLKDVKASLHQELIDIYENGSEERKVPEYPQTWYYVQDWYNAHHFDYRGLIEKGLAIDATGLNIY